MRYERAEAFRTALERRLKNGAEASGMALMRPAQARGLRAIPRQARGVGVKRLVLKGAFALEPRLGLRTRTTKDIDLGRADDEEAATEHLITAAGVDLGYFFDFEVRRTPTICAGGDPHRPPFGRLWTIPL